MRAFELFFRPWRDARVRTLVAGLPADLPRGVPLLLAANHVSWWDPFTLREMQRALRPGAPFFTVMLEAELARRPFFRRMGVVGLDPALAARRCARASASCGVCWRSGRTAPSASFRRAASGRRSSARSASAPASGCWRASWRRSSSSPSACTWSR